MEKIKMPVPIAELDGDEMTHVLWGMIKDTLIKPFVDLNTEYYDLSLPHREETADAVTAQAAEAIKRLKIGVKCATITPNLQRQEEYGLTQLWKSPNATIRAALDGTVFRAPILLKRVKPVVTCWEKPVTIARHAYGDLYKAVEYRVPGAGKAELVFTDESGRELSRQTVFDFNGPGVVQAMHNRDASILSFARCCFTYALSVGQDVWFGAKDTISKDYDQTFKLLFQQVYDEEFKAAFEQAGLHYRYALIDDIAAKVLRSKGGIVWCPRTAASSMRPPTAPSPTTSTAGGREKRYPPTPWPPCSPGPAPCGSGASWTATPTWCTLPAAWSRRGWIYSRPATLPKI